MNATVVVRRGGTADQRLVRELGARTAPSSVSALRIARYDDVIESFERLAEFVFGRRHDVLIAEDAGEPVGFLLLLYDVPDEVTGTEQAFIAYTAVEPAARRRGVARALLEAAEAYTRQAGIGYVSLMVTEDNTPARGLYDGAGYVTERRMLTKAL